MARTLPRQAPNTTDKTAVIGDNSGAIEEANRVQLISIVSKLSGAEDEIELAKGPLKAAQKKRKQIIGLGKAAGFPAWELEARLAEMKRPTREMAEIADREHKQRRWLGILDADQSELMLGDKAPQSAKDEAHWKGEGYKAGLRQLPPVAPSECPPGLVQAWMKEQERGYIETTTANAPKPLVVKAAEDFKEDNPEVDLDKAARALRNSSFMDTSPEPELDDPDNPNTEEPFEASEEELALQKGRPTHDDAVVD